MDKGVGMPPEVVARIFEPFFTTKEVVKGSDLGLAQAHGFALASRLALRVDSADGGGTSISLVLPRASGEVELQRERLGPPPTGSARSSGRTILFVEDDDDVAAMVVDLLGQLGHGTIRASNASSALGMLADARHVDLVLSDAMMSGDMNGVELAAEVRRRRSDLPILLNSGYSGAAQTAADAMGVEILPKPFTLDELDDAIATALKASQARPA